MTRFIVFVALSLPAACWCWSPIISTSSSSRCRTHYATQQCTVQQMTSQADDDSLLTRRNMLSSSLLSMAVLLSPQFSNAASDAAAPTILPCAKPSDGSAANCVSTASVRQVDLYIPPWTYDESMPTGEVLARLKGLITSDPTLSLLEDGDSWVSAKATRNLGTVVDQIDFVVNPSDHVITFQSKQIEPVAGASDFGANRNRLETLRKQSVFGRMGQDMETADTAAQEGTLGQLKAFWGLQSGSGFEDINLE